MVGAKLGHRDQLYYLMLFAVRVRFLNILRSILIKSMPFVFVFKIEFQPSNTRPGGWIIRDHNPLSFQLKFEPELDN